MRLSPSGLEGVEESSASFVSEDLDLRDELLTKGVSHPSLHLHSEGQYLLGCGVAEIDDDVRVILVDLSITDAKPLAPTLIE